jgi:hypothetical protein
MDTEFGLPYFEFSREAPRGRPSGRDPLKKLGENSFKDLLLAFLLRFYGFRIRTDLKGRGESR